MKEIASFALVKGLDEATIATMIAKNCTNKK
jgi:hypothetical protein